MYNWTVIIFVLSNLITINYNVRLGFATSLLRTYARSKFSGYDFQTVILFNGHIDDQCIIERWNDVKN